jgi:hypothetical protein
MEIQLNQFKFKLYKLQQTDQEIRDIIDHKISRLSTCFEIRAM